MMKPENTLEEAGVVLGDAKATNPYEAVAVAFVWILLSIVLMLKQEQDKD